MRIATFNANSIRSRLDTVLAWLTAQKPDVLCLQETKVQDKDFPVTPFTDAGYHVAFRGEKAHAGVAVISRDRPAAVRFGLDDRKPPDPARLAYVRVGGVHVVNTYVPQGRTVDHPMYRYKLQWFRRLKAYFERHFTPRMKVVWAGDLNVAPQPMDVHNPQDQQKHVCYHAAVREAFREVTDWGFVDVVRKHHPEPGLYSFFDYRMRDSVKKGMGWRVDHILATRCLARRSGDAFIDLEPRLASRPSDHTFVAADFAV